MAKLKQYNLTTLIRGVEVLITCATNSKKNFALLIDKPYGYVKDYTGQGSEIETCVANPHKLYVMRGLGGETLVIFEKERIYEYEEALGMIGEHRKTYNTNREWYESKK